MANEKDKKKIVPSFEDLLAVTKTDPRPVNFGHLLRAACRIYAACPQLTGVEMNPEEEARMEKMIRALWNKSRKMDELEPLGLDDVAFLVLRTCFQRQFGIEAQAIAKRMMEKMVGVAAFEEMGRKGKGADA